MHGDDYNANSIDAVLSRIEQKIDSQAVRSDKFEKYLVEQNGRVNQIEKDALEAKTANRTIWKVSSIVSSLVGATAGAVITGWFQKK